VAAAVAAGGAILNERDSRASGEERAREREREKERERERDNERERKRDRKRSRAVLHAGMNERP